MRTKWLLLALPLAILAFLLQSALWVPTFASQAKSNPERLVTFIRGTIGDAKFPNPILMTDRGTSDVFEKNVFEMLLREDDKLGIGPGLAERWETTEEALIAALPERALPNGERATAAALKNAVEEARRAGTLGDSIVDVSIVPAGTLKKTVSVAIKDAKGKEEPTDVALTVELPERVKLRLSRVEPQLFEKLEPLLGKGYFDGYPFESRFKLDKPELLSLARSKFPEVLAIGEHNPIVTFHLHAGVKWHDGAPFTAEDVKFTYQAILDPRNASPRASSYEDIKSVDVLDPLTVEVVYEKLYSPAIIEWAWMGMIPKHLLDANALAREADRRKLSVDERQKLTLRTSDFNRHPIGTGPFRFVEWLPDQYIRLQRFDGYWGKPPQYRDLYFRVLPDKLAMEVEFGAGALDLYEADPHQAQRYRQDPHYQVLDHKEGYYVFIGYNNSRWPFDDARVRRALGMAIDVNALIKYALSGEGHRATGPFYGNTPFSDPEVKPLPYDPKRAAELLAEAGFVKNAAGILQKDGKPLAFTLVTNVGNPSRKAVMIIAQEAWKKLGVDCKINVIEWTVFLEDFALKHNFDALVFGWVGGDASPDRYQIWHSSQSAPYKLNMVNYSSREADALIETIQRTYDTDEQVRLARKLHRVIADDQPYTFLYEPHQPRVIDRRIMRVGVDAQGQEHYTRIDTPPSGDTMYYFNQWRKLSHAPEAAR
jgi:ABC-type transport system substrate-binding protein